MSCRMTGNVQDVNTTVPKVVPGVVFTKLHIEWSFDNVAVFEIRFPERRLLLRWVARQELVFEPWSDNQVNRRWKLRKIAT